MNISQLKRRAEKNAQRRGEKPKRAWANRIVSLLLCGVASTMISGCGNTPSQPPLTPSAAPPAKLTAVEQKFVTSAKSMSPQEQGDFFRKNPEMTRNSSVMAKIRAEMPKLKMQPTRGEKPRLKTGRPDFVK